MKNIGSLRHRGQRWCDWFLFESCDPRVASLLRITYGLLMIVYIAVWMLDGALWFSDNGILSPSTAKVISGGYHSSIFFAYSSAAFVQACLVIMMLQAVLLLLGCWSRFQMTCLFLWLVSFQHRNMMILDCEDTVFRWFAFLMIFLPLDHRWSLGRWISDQQSSAVSEHTWALRLIQIQVAIIYLSSAWCKFQGDTWRDGTALFYVSRLDDYFGRFWLPDLVFDTAGLVRLMTWSVLAIELLIPIAIWWPRLRLPAMTVGILLHLGIEYTMNLFLFQWIMIVGLLSFIRLPAQHTSLGQDAPAPIRRKGNEL